MNFKSQYWSNWSTADFAQMRNLPTWQQTVAILPVAATEQHGPHLPVSVDAIILEGILEATLPQVQGLPILVLPTQSIGFSPEHSHFAGTLSLSVNTLLGLWGDLAAGIAATGIRKILLLNSHGGQHSLLDVAARQMRSAHGLSVYGCSWYNLPVQNTLDQHFSKTEQRIGVHAGAVETALMLAIAPKWVQMQLAQNFDSTTTQRIQDYPILGNGKSAKLGWLMQDINAQGAAGNAQSATLQQGQALLSDIALHLASMLKELVQSPPLTNQVHSARQNG